MRRKQNMPDIQAIAQAKTQPTIETVKAVVQAIAVVEQRQTLGSESKAVSVGSRLGGASLKQTSFDQNATDKYVEIKNCRLEVNNISIILHKSCTVPIVKNW